MFAFVSMYLLLYVPICWNLCETLHLFETCFWVHPCLQDGSSSAEVLHPSLWTKCLAGKINSTMLFSKGHLGLYWSGDHEGSSNEGSGLVCQAGNLPLEAITENFSLFNPFWQPVSQSLGGPMMLPTVQVSCGYDEMIKSHRTLCSFSSNQAQVIPLKFACT